MNHHSIFLLILTDKDLKDENPLIGSFNKSEVIKFTFLSFQPWLICITPGNISSLPTILTGISMLPILLVTITVSPHP